MATGTRYYAVALVATGYISTVMILLHLLNFGSSRMNPGRLLRVRLPSGIDPESALGPKWKELFTSYSIILVENVRQGVYTDVLLSVLPNRRIGSAQVVEELLKINGNLKVTYDFALHTDDL